MPGKVPRRREHKKIPDGQGMGDQRRLMPRQAYAAAGAGEYVTGDEQMPEDVRRALGQQGYRMASAAKSDAQAGEGIVSRMAPSLDKLAAHPELKVRAEAVRKDPPLFSKVGEHERLFGGARVMAARELPDVRAKMIAQLDTPYIRQLYASYLRTGLQLITYDPRVTDDDRQAQIIVEAETDRLRRAQLFWVSPDMTRLCLQAAPDMPAFFPGPDDLPAPRGLIYFATPFADYEPWTRVMVDGRQLVSGKYRATAASWGPYDRGGQWKKGGTWFTFYTGGRPAGNLCADGSFTPSDLGRLTEEEWERIEARAPLRLDNEAAVPCDPGDYPAWELPLADAVREPGATASWMHLVLCAFRLMATARAARTEAQPVERAARRRSERAGVAADAARAVNVMDIAAPRRPPRPADEQGTGRVSREYHTRWMVSGHWRNQWYPASEAHRPRWIDSYVKGPEDKPLRVSQTVRVFRSAPQENGGER
jgi:hypothetical protein